MAIIIVIMVIKQMVSCLCLQSVFLYLFHPGMLTFSYCSGVK